MTAGTTGVAFASAFIAGAISFLSPCVLPLVPGYLSFVAGRSLDDLRPPGRPRAASLGLAGCFVLGFALVFIALGAAASTIGQLLAAFRGQADRISGAIVILFGLHMTGLMSLPWLQRDIRLRLDLPGGRPLAAGLLGAAFAFGWTPCIGPILGTILTVAGRSDSVPLGSALLAAYAGGLAIPFLLVAGGTGRFLTLYGRLRRTGRILQVAAGTILTGAGLAIATGEMEPMSNWLLIHIPVLQKIIL